MPTPKRSHRSMFDAAKSGNLREVFQALTLRAAEEMRPEEQGGKHEVPPWFQSMLRNWVAYERGVMEHVPAAAEQDDGGADELAAVLTAIAGGKS